MIIPYLGEKSKLANFITPYIPTDISTYVEPFGGLMGIFFSLDFSKYKQVKFIYNDKNYLNYLLFDKMKNDSSFIDLVKQTKVDKSVYDHSLNELDSEKDESNLALNWLIVLTCSSPYEIGKDSWRGSNEFEIFKLKWKAYQYLISKIDNIHNLDYNEIIDKYDSESTFFYVDPPYMGKEKYYINHDFCETSHKELAKKLNNIKGKFLLSYYNFDGLEDLYQNCKFDKKMAIMGTEYIIMNY